MVKNIRPAENLHILLWLIKDICWCLNLIIPGLIMIIPTIAFAFYITWRMREIYCELMHNLAVCCWICANSIWMIGEFFYDDGLRLPALVFFITGLIIVSFYYCRLLIDYLSGKDKNPFKNPSNTF